MLSISTMKNAKWIDKPKENMQSEKQNTVKINKDNVKGKLKSMPVWKGVGPDKIQGFWLKLFAAVSKVLNKCTEVGNVPGWLVELSTILVMNNSKKGTEVLSYRPIACLS